MSAAWSISTYDSSVCDEVSALACAAFGEGYLTPRRIEDLARANAPFYIARDNHQVAGYCVFTYETAEDCAAKLKIPVMAIRKCMAKSSQMVCHAKSMALWPEYRRTGLADALFGACMRDALSARANGIWASAWKIRDKVPMDRIFRTNDFSVYGEVPLLWLGDNGYVCKICGGPCRCPGVIYFRAGTNAWQERMQ